MIKSFYIDGFRNLNNFTLCPKPHELSHTTFLVGLNGVGKSNVLDALKYVQQVALGVPVERPTDVRFKVVVSADLGEISWAFSYNQELQWSTEVVHYNQTVLLDSKEKSVHTPKSRLCHNEFYFNKKKQEAINILVNSLNCIKEDNLGNNTDHTKIKALADTVLNRRVQTFCSTNSALLLNYLPDDVAKASVMLLYKSVSGNTQSVRLFDLPSMDLTWQGPGEAYCHTGPKLTQEAQAYAATQPANYWNTLS